MLFVRKRVAAGFAMLAMLSVNDSATAAIQVQATRVIYAGESKAATLGLKNEASRPYMVQSWLDLGDKSAMPKGLPIVVTPPLMKLEPGRESTVRFIYSGVGLPKDKESLLWINVQEIPPVAQQENVLQIAIRSRIKLFYRPAGMPADLDKAAHSLQWKREGQSLYVYNPSPLHITFATLTPKGHKAIGAFVHDMVGPGETIEVLSGSAAQAALSGTFDIDYINDYGGYSQLKSILLTHR
ncbi:putative fimbrial chaperone YadV [Carnimonas sp. R-84981]|uniref:fimbrial biogenesis chaperone n=1 Tax=Carnimonas bestiolae TaxID=3402172 RepID=UPI003EDC9695